MAKLTEAEERFLDKYVNFINTNVPNRGLMSNPSIGNIKDQLHSVLRHDISGYFAWYAPDVTITMTILTNGDVTFNWGSTERELKSAKEAVALYTAVVDFGEKLQSQLKIDLESIKL